MKEFNELKQPVLNIGLAGHIDHGKTTLLHQLSGKWTNTHSEELKRGITIKLGYANSTIYKCPKCKEEAESYSIKNKCKCGATTELVREVSFIDVPGHEMLMATMLSGAAIIDAAILVIAVNEPCPKPQTKEHLVALQVKGVKDIIIVQNKADLVSKEEAEKNYKEIKEFVKGTIAENSPIIPCSAQQGVNIDAILQAITQLPIPKRDTASKPLFFIARSFDINKPGTPVANMSGGVLGGILKKGTLKVGDEIEIKPGMTIKKANETTYKPLKTKIISLYAGKNKLKEAIPCGSLAIEIELDPLLTKADNLVGCVVSTTGNLPETTNKISIKTNLFKEIIGTTKKIAVEPLKTNEPLLLSVNTAITLGIIKSIQKDKVELTLKIPVVVFAGDKIGITRNIVGHWRLIGWGEVL